MSRLKRLIGLAVLSLTGVIFVLGSAPAIADDSPTNTAQVAGGPDRLPCC
jgi:hypothetical protein